MKIMVSPRSILAALVFLSVAVSGPARAAGPESVERSPVGSDFEAQARRVMEVFDSTGFLAAVLVDGDVVFKRAFGKANERTGAALATDMLVPIASISKAFTSTALAILVDRGMLGWDTPIRTYIPEFAMHDPWVSDNFTVRDALTHRSGLPLGAGDLLFWPDGESSVDDIIAALPHLQPSTGFREAFAYDNLFYIVAGEVVARVAGKSWADFVSEEIFSPIGMDDCAADRSRVRHDQTLITGHERAPGADRGEPADESTLIKPAHAAAGGIVCPIDDMMRWAQFWLDGGVTEEGDRLISEAQATEVWSGVTPIRRGATRSEDGAGLFELYSLGWFVADFAGGQVVSHSGGAPGVVSHLLLLPEKNAAIFAASNDYRSAAPVFAKQIAGDLLDGLDYDYVEAAAGWFPESLAKARAELANSAEPPQSASSTTLPLSAYAGVYRDAWYGDVTITLNQGQLSIDMSRSELLDGPLTHFDGDRFTAFWPDRSLKADAFVLFEVESAEVVGMKMRAISEITDFSYDFHDLDLVRVQPAQRNSPGTGW